MLFIQVDNGGYEVEALWEQGTYKNVWIWEGESNQRVEKLVLWGALLLVVLSIYY